MPKQIIKGFISQIRGVSYKPTDVVDAENGTPIIRANNIQDDGMIYDDLVFVYIICLVKNTSRTDY